MNGELYIGLMCGTSADAIDAALVSWPAGEAPVLHQTVEQPLPHDLRQALLDLNNNPLVFLKQLSKLDTRIADAHAEAVEQLLDRANLQPSAVKAIGFHGQTVDHSPEASIANTNQLGNAQRLATRCNISVIADLRRADMAVGGEGAPLAPAMHAELFRRPNSHTAVVNIGGIANLSLMPADTQQAVLGFDTGPGNCLMDEWVRKHFNQPYDHEGELARQGTIQQSLLNELLNDAYFRRVPPKSTGRDFFNLEWLERHIGAHNYALADVQATLAGLTCKAIVADMEKYQPATHTLYVCGGGARNPIVMQTLATEAPATQVMSTAARGLPAEWVEAMLMGWLAMRHCEGLSGNIPSVTGASQSVRLGVRYDPPSAARCH